MIKSRWQYLRLSLLALTLGVVLWTLLRTILSPNTEKTPLVSNFVFPSTVPLSEWQNLKSTPSQPTDKSQAQGQSYQYRRNNEQLNIEARYEIYTEGNVGRLLNVYTPIKPATVNLTIKHQENIGFYSLFNYQEKAYLSACINPKGEATVTAQQFTQNKYAYGFDVKRMLFWVAGQNDLFDGRCLWTLLSIPIDSSESDSLEKAYQTLEKVWFEWYPFLKLEMNKF